MIQPERIQPLNAKPVRNGRYVLYWMQASQRAECNHALEHAIRQANRLQQPLLAAFGLTEKYPQANERHYAFMLEGLRETQQALRRRGVQLVVHRQSPDLAAAELAQAASLVVTDRGYTDVQKRWRRRVARSAACRVVQVETDVVVPVEVASDKDEFAAATLRPKIHRNLDAYLRPLEQTRLERDSLEMEFHSLDFSDVDALLGRLRLDRSAGRVSAFTGGASRAKRLLRTFIAGKLQHYHTRARDPAGDIQSHQSPYLHFGQISPLAVALQIRAARGKPPAAKEAFLEQLIVRRELSMNLLRYNRQCCSFRCLPAWARSTLAAHKKDRRRPVVPLARLERAETHDPYWNAAMREMLLTGKMHGHMRMYWGKKILEWTRSPEHAFRTAVHLNNKYFLDGRDPNSWNNVAWCFGLHDRPWGERPIFGKVRYMNAAGLERKFDMAAYGGRMRELT